MRSPARCAACVLPFLLSGCSIFHRSRPAPIQALAPVIEPSMPLEIKSVEIPPSQSVIAAKPIYNMKERAVSIRQPAKRHKPANRPPEETDVATTPAAAAPAVNAIGVMSSGDPANSRQQTQESIASAERGLNGINRSLNDSEQKTAGQIREFLKEAKSALASGDIDGAHTLTEKAKALLAELTK
jgi:hypothetical protein